MKISLYSKVGSFLVASLFATSCAQQENMVQTLTPVPVSYQTEQGKFQWDAQTQLFAEGEKIDTSIIETAFQHAPQPIKWTEALPKSNFIRLTLVPELKGITSPEGYTLQITSNGIQIEATTHAGLFYGVQSILQLAEQGKGAIQAAIITDEPRFEYRGIMLDVSRHFRSKEFVKKQIDLLASYKINRLHLHLTDAAGWRIEIDKYPRLTEFAAWRKGETWKEWGKGGNQYCEATDPEAKGGYYTCLLYTSPSPRDTR